MYEQKKINKPFMLFFFQTFSLFYPLFFNLSLFIEREPNLTFYLYQNYEEEKNEHLIALKSTWEERE